MKTEQGRKLIKKYIREKADPKESHLVESFIESKLIDNSWDISPEEKKDFGVMLKQRIDDQIAGGKHPNGKPSLRFKKFWIISAAAAILVVFILGGLYYVNQLNESFSSRIANDIAPGGNFATLTLSDGKKINLNDPQTGELASLNGISVKKSANGVLVFSAINANSKNHLDEVNTLETPLGGQYQVNLSDGTKVWLNAGSRLIFPTRFSGTQRQVELHGEAYFEVSKDPKHAFIVKSKQQEIKVLGTNFNVNSYDDEPGQKTTLLEGEVKVKNPKDEISIFPGEQAISTIAGIEVSKVDPAVSIDWKNGEFRFKQESLSSITRKLSRWYGVNFIFDNQLKNVPSFSGSVSRFDQISAVLKMLEETGNLKFYINGKTITVK